MVNVAHWSIIAFRHNSS